MKLNRIIRTTCGVVTVLALAVSAAGCGASDKDSATSGSGSSEAKKWADEAATRLAEFQSDPGTINVSDPLPGKPAAGKKVHFLVLNLPTTQIAQEGMKAAAKAVGWDLTTVLLDPTDAQAFSAGVEQAIAAKADYIVGAALALSTAGEAVAKAKAAGIPVMVTYGTDPAGGADGNGIYVSSAGPEWVGKIYPAAVDWAIAKSGGTAHMLYVNVPDIPIMKVTNDANAPHMKEACPTCTYEELGLSVADMSNGSIPSQVVSKLQSDPKIDYIFFGFADLGTGVYEALQAAGLADKVKLISASANPSDLAAIAKGKGMDAGTLNGQPYVYWMVMDAMLRLDAGETIDPETYAYGPLAVADESNVGTVFPVDADWFGPKGFEDKFKALWQVG
jgi:ABC-type sugar transport system substrate-binding protein